MSKVGYPRPVEESMLSSPFLDDPLIRQYCKALRKARWAARIVGFLHNWSTFLSFCSLTWATVVLLGAFVSDLYFTDYFFVTSLLLFEAARLASAACFTEILTRSPDPGHLNQAGNCTAHDARHCRLHRARILSPFSQAILIAPSFICAIIRLLNTRFYGPGCVDHLQISLRIFYVLIIANAAVSSLHLFGSFMAWMHLKSHELSILRYYDEVLHNVLTNGVIQADNFNFFQYAFKMLGRDYAKCEGWETVVKGHKMMLTYIYAHKQGADYLKICLDSEDVSVRQAAANMVGMWADEKRGVGLKMEDLELPPELLMKLADMVGTGEVGWAATNSFGALAKRNPQYLVQILTSSKEPVLHRIAQLVNESSTRSLACVRTLVLFYNQIFLQQLSADQGETRGMTAYMTEAVQPVRVVLETKVTTEMRTATTTDRRPDPGHCGHYRICFCQPVHSCCSGNGQPGQEAKHTREDPGVAGVQNLRETGLPKDIEAELVRKLKHLLKESKVQRLRVQAAYLLYLLGNLDDLCHQLIRAIDPSLDTHWYSIEQKMLVFFLKEMPSHPRYVVPDYNDIYEGGLL